MVADIAKSDLPHYAARSRSTSATSPIPKASTPSRSARRHRLQPLGQDAVADPGARQAPRLLLAGELSRHREHHPGRWPEAGANKLVHFTTDMIYGHSVRLPQTEDHPAEPLGEYGKSKLATEELAAELARQGHAHHDLPAAPDHRPGRLGILVKLFKLIDLQPAGADDRVGQEPLPVHLGVRLRRGGTAAWRAGVPERGLQSRLD